MAIQRGESIVVTLFEGDHHWGVASLLNSVAASGFRGRCVVGHRGKLPEWCDSRSVEGGWEFAPGCILELVSVDSGAHLARQKGAFMMRIFEERPEVSRCFYFDTDIVVIGDWPFFEEWLDDGLALVAHAWPLSPHHFHRHLWASFGEKMGLSVQRELYEYINSGFVGISRCDCEVLAVWQEILEALSADGLDLGRFQHLPSANPWKLTDQAALNLVAMITDRRLSIMDASAMDFAQFGFVMSHAAGPGKPWQFGYVRSALRGKPPQKSVYAWARFLEGPIMLYSKRKVRSIRRSLRVAEIIGRFYRHPMASYYPP